MNLTIFITVALSTILHVSAFSIPSSDSHRHLGLVGSKDSLTVLYMAGGKKRKRRRRKNPEQSSSSSVDTSSVPSSDASTIGKSAKPDKLPSATMVSQDDILDMNSNKDVAAMFSLSQDGIVDTNDNNENFNVDALPDIRNVLKKKEQKKLDAEMELQKKSKKKISRKDRKAFLELLEAEPFADADDSFFEEEEYGIVSAFLGEGALDFLGIPPGPLQIGHFIGALGIILCAFVEYPGFPLTNLPTPLRSSLQGGLATIYVINALLAVLAFFKAGERGQPGVLWAAKTFSVGGLAYDQLTQLPTLEEAKQLNAKR